ncbi:hypothetical protein CcaverHIS002_0109660 [Cutaneotrichosporon cavernicola]|uniref:Dolichyl-diphosphooligosaccharide-protein glycosyltransferase subunit OST5 n=1 Tax=Cutaneotrichosporon cavernicola TaxID=279322 RepID=A0AA48I2L5_9TREE|nr:uncharacterized protein CcaverHIS019_0109600 [Cutaneotrichosporon cavernicola]BEI80437.1 hypothetical protein CcaverHIS002_0109660 [Cutaneotrichosporon cavernicola]BEI88242.1 hypothetical protein CcaverHIS019_0109600 [Cutaneotrichosporon cavernicola]BEI96013.1 hypothetical protein CcaverHIS631_0109620 [Cutaneotrichosporon cavernicola]BEJ03787.1 hypothetical protein CcaverHIS641_0109620 [Cutaneotrichosporon cavernicola]
MEPYASVKAVYNELPVFKPLIPTPALPTIALVSLVTAFALVFFMTTQSSRKFNATEVPIAMLAAALTGAGTVALFCTVGVNV